jgi:HSP20 family protein
MATTRRFDPFGDMGRLDPYRGMDELFREISGRSADHAQGMRVDVTELAHHFLVIADLPGVSKDRIKVAIDANEVSISAEVPEESEADAVGALRRERCSGQLQRSITLPREVDEAGADARYENGVLRLTLPKKTASQATHLTIE